MGLESVKEEVIRQAKEQETAILASARKEANAISRETEKKIEEIREKSEAEAKRMIDVLKMQSKASAELESRKIVLEAKKQMIDSLFEEAKKKLESLDEKKREYLIKKLVEKAGKEIEIASIRCGKKDAKFLKGVNTAATDIIGGIIAENKDNTIRVDYSFDTMLESIKETELQNINKVLFG